MPAPCEGFRERLSSEQAGDTANDVIDLALFKTEITFDALSGKFSATADGTGSVIDLTDFGGGTITLEGIEIFEADRAAVVCGEVDHGSASVGGNRQILETGNARDRGEIDQVFPVW